MRAVNVIPLARSSPSLPVESSDQTLAAPLDAKRIRLSSNVFIQREVSYNKFESLNQCLELWIQFKWGLAAGKMYGRGSLLMDGIFRTGLKDPVLDWPEKAGAKLGGS